MSDSSNALQTQKFDGRKRIILLLLFFITIVIVSLTLIGYGLSLLANDEKVTGIIVVTIGIFVVMVGGISGRMYNQRTLQGIAIADEMSTFQLYKAGYFSFVGAFYTSVLMILLLENISTSRFVIYIGMGLNLIIFIVIHSIVRRGDMS